MSGPVLPIHAAEAVETMQRLAELAADGVADERIVDTVLVHVHARYGAEGVLALIVAAARMLGDPLAVALELLGDVADPLSDVPEHT